MASGEREISLAGEFPPARRDQWVKLVDAVMSKNHQNDAAPVGAGVAMLRSTTDDGIVIEPIYTSDDVDDADAGGYPGFFPFTRGRRPAIAGDGWDIRALVEVGDDEARAVAELERGATSVLLDLQSVAAITEQRLGRVLDGVLFDLATVALDAGPRWAEAARALLAVWNRSGVPAGALTAALGADPLGDHAIDPDDEHELDRRMAEVKQFATNLRDTHPGVRIVTVDAARYHNAGASAGEELGLMLAAGVEYLRLLTAGSASTRADDGGADGADLLAGADLFAVFGQIELRLAASADQFGTIAKIRAARRLWSRVAEVAGAAAAAGATTIHAITSTAMMTRYDPWVNALRSTVACFAAGVGGADSITVLAHDCLVGDAPSAIGKRLARNTQSVLILEAHLAKVVDPAGGSWYVEQLTEQLAAAAWAQFQRIEAAGGFRAAVASGTIREMIEATWEQRRHRLARRQDAITGVSEFPNIAEAPPPPLAPHRQPSAAGLATHRNAEIFENLRQRVDIATVTIGARPNIFLAAIGPASANGARVSFAKNFFEIGGLATVVGPDSTDPSEIAEAFASSGATVACLCSSDALYAQYGVAVATALQAVSGGSMYVAGRPRDLVHLLAAAGADRLIYVGCDVEQTLTELLTTLRVG